MTFALLGLALGCSGSTQDSNAEVVSDTDATGTDASVPIYAFDLGDAQWIAPATVSFLPEEPVLVGVEERDATVDLIIALGVAHFGKGPVQSPLHRTLRLTATLADDGTFAFGPQDVDEQGTDAELLVEDLAITGAFTPSRNAITSIVVSGRVDAAGVYGPTGVPDAAALCKMLADYDAKCGPCADGGIRCVPFELHQTQALATPRGPLFEVVNGSWCAGILVPPLGGVLFRIRRRKATA